MQENISGCFFLNTVYIHGIKHTDVLVHGYIVMLIARFIQGVYNC